ncbi:MAG: hypothetical protein GOP50_02650 [Candidatus Heimdallarchaeota archaeon]|nr:hypothetical protein [Candidatus Heimdallarchaeota archaeon]
MSRFSHDEELKEIFDSFLLELPDVQPGKVFGMPGYYVEGKLFASIFGSGLVIKLPKEHCENLIENEDGFDHFAPLGNNMKQWVVITKDDPESFEDEMDLILQSIEFVKTTIKK